MKESSNIGTAQIADQLGPTRQKEFLEKMGFLDPVESRAEGARRPLTPGNNWGPLETMTVGYGHGIAVTPLHLATGYATLFNGGVYRPATLLKVDRKPSAGPKGPPVFTEDTSYKMRALLRLVVTQGTGQEGRRARAIASAARPARPRNITTAATLATVVTTFAGVFPMDEPRYVIVVMLDDPKATAGNLRLPHRRLERRAGGQQDRQPDRADARRAPRQEPRARHGEVLPFVHETPED